MTRPQPSSKAAVNLASNPASAGPAAAHAPRPSRIRRDPPPVVKKAVDLDFDPEEREQWAVIAGILAFALAIFAIVLAAGSYVGWSPSDYTVEMKGD